MCERERDKSLSYALPMKILFVLLLSLVVLVYVTRALRSHSPLRSLKPSLSASSWRMSSGVSLTTPLVATNHRRQITLSAVPPSKDSPGNTDKATNRREDEDKEPMETETEFELGSFKNTSLCCLESVTTPIGELRRYRLQSVLSKTQSKLFMDQYKEEIKKRKHVFKGFRAGTFPPLELRRARKVVLVHGIENILETICYLNGLLLHTKDGNKVAAGQANQSYIMSIMQPDANGRTMSDHLLTWKEHYDYPFVVEFLASDDEPTDATATAEAEAAPDASIEEGAGLAGQGPRRSAWASSIDKDRVSRLEDGLYGMDMKPLLPSHIADNTSSSSDNSSIHINDSGEMTIEDVVAHIAGNAAYYNNTSLSGYVLYSDMVKGEIQRQAPSITYQQLWKTTRKMWKALGSKAQKVWNKLAKTVQEQLSLIPTEIVLPSDDSGISTTASPSSAAAVADTATGAQSL